MKREQRQYQELRSPKMRRVMDKIPGSLTLAAVLISLAILLAMALAVCLLPYPHGEGETILQHIL